MDNKETRDLTDETLLAEVKDNKPSPLIDAFFIGFLVGIILFSLFASTWGLLTLIPLVLAYRLLKKPRRV